MVFSPKDLVAAKWDFTNAVRHEMERRQLAIKFWLAATAEVFRASDMRRRELSVVQLNLRSAFRVTDMLMGDSADSPRARRAFKAALTEVRFPPGGATVCGPRSHMVKVAARGEGVEHIQKFDALTVGANVLRSCELSLRCAWQQAPDFGAAFARSRAEHISH